MRRLSWIAALTLFAAVAVAHDVADGSPCHIGLHPMSTGNAVEPIVEKYHCHETAAELAEKAEQRRQHQCNGRLATLKKALDAYERQLNNAYAKRTLAKKCADRESVVGKMICENAQKRYDRNIAAHLPNIDRLRRLAAEICRPEEMI